MMLCLQHGTARILLSGTCPNPAKSMAGAGFAINGRMPDLPEPKFGTSLESSYSTPYLVQRPNTTSVTLRRTLDSPNS